MRFKFLAAALAATALLTVTAPVAAEVPSSTEWQEKTVPLATFGQFPVIESPEISPDGRWIAAKVRADGGQVLAVMPVDPKAGKPVPIARDGDFDTDKKGEKEVYSWEWINSDTLLIWIRSRDNFQGSWYDNVRIAAYARETGKITPLAWANDVFGMSVLWKSTDEENPRVLIQRSSVANGWESLDNPEVLEVDVETGRFTTVMNSNPIVTNWDADADGTVRIGSSYDRDNGKVRVLYRPNASSNMRTVLHEKNDRFDDLSLPSLFLKGGKAYGYSSDGGYRALYEFNLDTMQMGKKVFGVDGYDVGGAILSRDGSSLDGVRVVEGRSQQYFFDPRLKEISAMLEEGFGEGNVYINSVDDKREKVVFTAAALGQAPALYIFDTPTGAISLFAYQNATLKNAKLNPVSVVRYPTSDAKEVEAVLTMPRHRTGEKNLPLIILVHGGPEARDSADWDFYQWSQALAELGYVVLQPNYRGSTGYGTEWHKAVKNNWGHRMQDDLNDAIPYLASKGIADPERVCMMGWSYGGYAASRAAQRDGDKYRCAISGAGVHDLPDMMAYDKNYLGRYGAKTVMGAAGTDLKDISPGLHPEQYSAPILIIHGERDERVPVSQSRDLVSRLKRAAKVAGQDFVYVEQPLNTHNLLREEDRIQLLTEVKKFLDRHNPA